MSWIDWLAGLSKEQSKFADRVDHLIEASERLQGRFHYAQPGTPEFNYLYEQLEAIHHDLCTMHNVHPQSAAGDLLGDVILCGEEYEHVIRKVMRLKLN